MRVETPGRQLLEMNFVLDEGLSFAATASLSETDSPLSGNPISS